MDAVNLRTLMTAGGLGVVARAGNLPDPTDPDPSKRPSPNKAYLIRLDGSGDPLYRLAYWDASAPPPGSQGAVTVDTAPADPLNYARLQDLPDTANLAPGNAAILTKLLGHYWVWAGGPYVVKPTDAHGALGPAIVGTTLKDGDKLGYIDTNAGTGRAPSYVWKVNSGSFIGGAGTAATGAWEYITLHDWIKDTDSKTDHAAGQSPGDFQSGTELDKETLKVWDGNAWVTLLDSQKIKRWIAAGSLFQGVVTNNAGIGALPTPGPTNRGYYWTWNGASSHPITAADFTNGGGFAGNLNPGDWIQSDGTKFVLVTGDLLSKTRADGLFSLSPWAAGSYEQGALISHAGSIWKANGPILAADVAPDATGAKWTRVALTAGVKNVPTDGDLPATAPPADVYLVLNSAKAGSKPALFSYDPAARVWVQLGSSSQGTPLDLSGGKEMRGYGVPVGSMQMWMTATAPAGWLFAHGQTFTAAQYPELALVFPGLRLPDMRGAYPRGAGLNSNGSWGDAANAPMGWQDYATARPTTAFTATTGTAGDHNHPYQHLYKVDPHWRGGGGASNDTTANGPSNYTTGNSGNHTHTATVDGGGDSETRPRSVFVEFILKVTDQTITLVA